jgi:small subunit ribosomal protein S1
MRHIECKENKKPLIIGRKATTIKLVPGSFIPNRTYEFSLYTFYDDELDRYLIGIDTRYHLPTLLEGEADPNVNAPTKLITGEIYDGKVIRINDFGVYVRIGYLVGLLHIDDISYVRLSHPNKKLTKGQQLVVKVLAIEGDRISLGLKQLDSDPWDSPELDLLTGSIRDCIITDVLDYGVLVEVMPGVIGLIHITELFWGQVSVAFVHHRFKKNQRLSTKVLSVDTKKRTIALSIKQLSPDPWITISQRYRVGQIVSGQVVVVHSYALLVMLKSEMFGMVHISDLSYSHHYAHCDEYAKVGDKIKGVIQSINVDKRQVLISIKHMESN